MRSDTKTALRGATKHIQMLTDEEYNAGRPESGSSEELAVHFWEVMRRHAAQFTDIPMAFISGDDLYILAKLPNIPRLADSTVDMPAVDARLREMLS